MSANVTAQDTNYLSLSFLSALVNLFLNILVYENNTFPKQFTMQFLNLDSTF